MAGQLQLPAQRPDGKPPGTTNKRPATGIIRDFDDCVRAAGGSGGEVSWRPGHIVAYTHDPVTVDDPGGPAPQVFNVLLGQAGQIRSTPFGEVGTVFSGQGIEMVWVSKLAEPIDENWFCSEEADLILVMQGQLKVEFESPSQPDRVLDVGDVLVLPAGQRCRAYRWPRDARQATIFVAAYPTGQNPPAAWRAR